MPDNAKKDNSLIRSLCGDRPKCLFPLLRPFPVSFPGLDILQLQTDISQQCSAGSDRTAVCLQLTVPYVNRSEVVKSHCQLHSDAADGWIFYLLGSGLF